MRQAKSQDVANWYSRLNAILTGHGLSGVAAPEISGAAKAAQVTPLTDKLESMKTDTYYKLATYSDWGQAVKGAIMREQTPSGVEATLSSIEATIVCRNTAANSHGTCANGTHSNGSKSNGSNSDGYYKQSHYHNGVFDDICTETQRSYGDYSHGTHSKDTKSNGNNTNGSAIDVGNTNSSHNN